MSEKTDISRPTKLSWWDYIATAGETIRLIWKYGPEEALRRVKEMQIEVTRELNRMKYKP